MIGDTRQVLSVSPSIFPEEKVDHGAVDVQRARFQIDLPALQSVFDQFDGADGTAANLHLLAVAAGKHVISVEQLVQFFGVL